MFTGIIGQLGTVRVVERRDGDLRLGLDAPGARLASLAVGDSVAVNGVCLTLAGRADCLWFDVSAESLSRTALGRLAPGDRVNLETAVTLATPLGGHLVSGHVDGLARVESMTPCARSTVMLFSCARRHARFIAVKGSVCIDGVSLTVNSVEDREREVRFSVSVVPHTLRCTNLGLRAPGDETHLEVDQVARYLARIASAGGACEEGEGA